MAFCELHPVSQKCVVRPNYLHTFISIQKSDSKIWEKKEQISSLLLEADIVELELEIARASDLFKFTSYTSEQLLI